MKLNATKSDKKGKGDDKAPDHVHMPWDAAMSAINSGAYDAAGYPNEDRADVDMPLSQTPAPGVDPVGGGKEKAADGDVLTNVTEAPAAIASSGLPTTSAPAPAAEPAKASTKS